MMTLGIVLVGTELRVMIEVPARELARRDTARHRIQPPQRALGGRTAAIEDRVVHDFVQEHGEIEHGEALHQRQRHPYERARDRDQPPGGQREDRELARRNQQVARGALRVERLQHVPRQLAAELGPQRCRVLAVMMGFHWTYGGLYQGPGTDG